LFGHHFVDCASASKGLHGAVDQRGQPCRIERYGDRNVGLGAEGGSDHIVPDLSESMTISTAISGVA
jgi:hypothetical protein